MNKGINAKFDLSRPMDAWPDFRKKEIIQSCRKGFMIYTNIWPMKDVENALRRFQEEEIHFPVMADQAESESIGFTENRSDNSKSHVK